MEVNYFRRANKSSTIMGFFCGTMVGFILKDTALIHKYIILYSQKIYHGLRIYLITSSNKTIEI